MPLSSPIAFFYNESLDVLRVGGINTGVGGVFSGERDFSVLIDSFSTTPSSTSFNATFGDGELYGTTQTVTVSFTPTTQAVSEPLSLSLVGVGMAGLTLFRRRRPAGNDQVQPA